MKNGAAEGVASDTYDTTANVYRDLQGPYEEIGVQGFQIYGVV